jgi:hypothetical protein
MKFLRKKIIIEKMSKLKNDIKLRQTNFGQNKFRIIIVKMKFYSNKLYKFSLFSMALTTGSIDLMLFPVYNHR